jgi:acyl-coenzyme A thioesterase PaaI-like protein
MGVVHGGFAATLLDSAPRSINSMAPPKDSRRRAED